MTDDISKVVPPEAVPVKDDALNFGVVQAKDWVIPTACGVRVVDERMAYGWNECRKATIDRMESATTPAEVMSVQRWDASLDQSGFMERCDTGSYIHVEDYATLAHQLAKSERDCAELRALLTAQNAAIARTDDLARQLAEANSELAMHRVDATRVAACPWRVQKGHASECQPPKRLQDALDQLAEATRRLGEVRA